MAAVNILPAFDYKWAETGVVEALDDAQYKAGWAFIGATPPSVEQFNKVHQIADEKANYLYAQMKAVFDEAGLVPAAGTLTTLRDAIALSEGRMLGIQVFTANGIYTPTPGTKWIEVEMVGGGASGAGTPNVAGGSSIAFGGGGSGASYARGRFLTGFSGAAVTVGAGGAGVANSAGTAGGTSSLGALITAPGGVVGSVAPVLTPGTTPTFSGGTNAPAAPTGANIIGARGGFGTYGIFLSGPTSYATGPGGASAFGAGAPSVIGGAGSTPGLPALSPGAGGSGALTTGGGAQQAGGNGASGVVVIKEFS